MQPRPFSLLVGALTAGPTAEGGRPSAGTDLEPLFAERAARSFASPPFWSSGCHLERPSTDFVIHYVSDGMGATLSSGVQLPDSRPWRVASHRAQAFTGVYASEETSDFRLSP
jgi:hypothetical protein